MGIIVRKDFSGGWWPSQDAIKAPENVFLRMDNCVLDEQGIVALRQGSSKINSVALTDTDIHSLFSTLRSGSKVRYAGAGSKVYFGAAYATDLGTTFAGTATDQIQFGAWLGQVFQARSTTKKKHDGTTQRTWGIAAPSAPTVSAQSASTTTVATFASAEAPAFAASEGTIAFANGETGTANEAISVTPAAATGRFTITKIFAADQDFSTIGGTVESGLDLFDLASYFTEPDKVQKITVSFGFGSDANDYFNDGRYEFMFQLGGTRQQVNAMTATAMVDAATKQIQAMAATAPAAPGEPAPSTANKRSREEVLERIQPVRGLVYREVREAATGDTGWTHLLCSRSQFSKVGSTTARGWSTIRAFKITFEGTAGSTGAVRFDNAILRGQAEDGMRIGDYKARVAFEYNDGATVPYIERSGPSSESSSISLYGQKLRVTLAAPGGNWNTLDTQINKVIVYIMGGVLDQYYEYSTKTAVPAGAGALDIDIGDTDVDLLIANNPLQLDNSVPPDNIIAIEGPHHNRLFVLTSDGTLVYSHRRRPGEFMTLHALKVGDGNESTYWLKRTNRGIYAGTSRDIYEVSGDGAEQPDGSIDFKIEGLSVGSPPVDACVAAEGNTLFYRAADGIRVFDGGQSIPAPRAQVDLLWRGYTRHGVSPLNTTTGRFRAAVRAGVLTFIAPEGASTTSSATLHRADFTRNQWYRFTYPSAWRALFVEPDGVLIGSDTSGFVRILDDSSASNQDAGTGQSIQVWTSDMDGGQPFQRKQIEQIALALNTGSSTLTVGPFIDQAAGSTYTITTTNFLTHRSSYGTEVTRFQLRLSGTMSTFTLMDIRVAYREYPVVRLNFYSDFLDPGVHDNAWLREVRIKARFGASSVSVTPYLNGTIGTPVTLTVGASTGLVKLWTVPFGREIRGGTIRLFINITGPITTDTTGMEIFWIEPRWDEVGNVSEKKSFRLYPDQADFSGPVR